MFFFTQTSSHFKSYGSVTESHSTTTTLDSVPETCEKYPLEHAMHDVAPANTAETDSGAVFTQQDRQLSQLKKSLKRLSGILIRSAD